MMEIEQKPNEEKSWQALLAERASKEIVDSIPPEIRMRVSDDDVNAIARIVVQITMRTAREVLEKTWEKE